ncbi:iron ABC transporter permease [Marinomonas rhizomae]|uniref:Iron complex transport system permease protein n=1 Tax=Marinomonas rhizomae TaxID=491948 RepID=A0A366JH95_9GAMM|nr:iron chelate uptake ABC transporter family permease subunit [Marinomonas rhizomae]RBP85704.1 iron complex transport system permease protein [Marinomonas rhizomae]RNF75672.1 iron ABC transporter permease [Marinomonas rhizomae]
MLSNQFQKSILKGVISVWLLSSFLFITWGLTPGDHFFLMLRFEKWLALNAVGVAVAVSTYVFQTLTHSRILTPSIMGLDAIYLLISLVIISALGTGSYLAIDAINLFLINSLVMIGFALLIFGGLILRFHQDMNRLLLIGIVIGLLIQALNEFLGRMISPEDFVVFQGAAFARFDQLDRQVVWVALVLLTGCLCLIWRFHPVLDIFRLGRSHVINLGIAYVPMTCLFLMLVAVLVSISTALVGPILFFGLLVVALVQQCFPAGKSGYHLLLVAMVGALILVAGQTLFEHVLSMKATLSVVIEVIGGCVFFMLLIKRGRSD